MDGNICKLTVSPQCAPDVRPVAPVPCLRPGDPLEAVVAVEAELRRGHGGDQPGRGPAPAVTLHTVHWGRGGAPVGGGVVLAVPGVGQHLVRHNTGQSRGLLVSLVLNYNDNKEAPVKGAQAGVPLPGLAAVQAHTPLPPVDSAGEVNIILCHVMSCHVMSCYVV